jgi:DNA polymerase III epsilon subunit-like protein
MPLGGYLFFDTETTGMWDFRGDPLGDHQPHVVQLAGILDDENGKTVATLNTIVKLPEGVGVPTGACNVHGITTERANREGMERIYAFGLFALMNHEARMRVAHNIQYDDSVLNVNYHRIGKKYNTENVPFCTQHTTTPLCKLPGGRRRGYKWPKLEEAYKLLVNVEGFEDAHDAMADVKACREVFYYLKENGHVPG